MKYGDTYVDEKYSSILEPNLFADDVLVPGMTFNNEHQKDANSGKIYIYKETKGEKSDPSTPAGDFNDENTANSLIPITLNNAYRKSKKIYQVTANSVPYALAEENLSLAVAENRENRQYSALACLVKEGTESTISTNSTVETVKKDLITDRKVARKAFTNPDVVLCSPDFYALILEAAGTQFTPVMNDRVAETANIGKWLGFLFVEANGLQGTAKYYDSSSTLQTVNLDEVEYVMYDHRTFHIVDNLEVMRIIDSENFAGVKAQNEINTGFKISNDVKVIVKKTIAKYTITYDVNGGSGSIDPVNYTGTPIELDDGTGLTGPEGMPLFKGWAKTATAQNPTVTSPFTPTADTTLYAVWAEE